MATRRRKSSTIYHGVGRVRKDGRLYRAYLYSAGYAGSGSVDPKIHGGRPIAVGIAGTIASAKADATRTAKQMRRLPKTAKVKWL